MHYLLVILMIQTMQVIILKRRVSLAFLSVLSVQAIVFHGQKPIFCSLNCAKYQENIMEAIK